MKRFILRIIFFFLIVFIVDTLSGNIFRYLQSHSKGGATGRMEYIANEMTDSILIMGTSRAINHYDPRVFIDSLGLSTFNCGMSGNGIIFNYGEYCMLRERYVPRIILYDFYDRLDLTISSTNERFLDGLRPFYDKDGVDSIFIAVDRTERYKMLSQIRRYNGRYTSLILDYLKPRIGDIKGYRPLYGKMNYEKESQEADGLPYDPLKIAYIEKLIKDTKQNGTELIFCISPVYGGGDDSIYKIVMDFAAKNDILLLNHYNDSTFIFKREYFKNSLHLNSEGSDTYTKKIISEIKQYLSQI